LTTKLCYDLKNKQTIAVDEDDSDSIWKWCLQNKQ